MNLFEGTGSFAATGNERMGLLRTHQQHLPGKRESVDSGVVDTGFRDALLGSLNEVNAQQTSHEQLSVQAVVDPESVDPHDLTIAAAKATTSLSITRNVVDRVIQAYRDITNLR
jgi:flagellar hook-basal body complex protein FliE